jgi:bile acid-coenzyme A ligase
MTQSEPVPPIGSQISALAQLGPDEPAVTCDGRTLTRGELDRSTNRLARAYAERGVGVGDYVTIVLPNSVECVQAMVACWKLGAVPQPLSARLPDTEFAGLLELRPRVLLVGRTYPGIPSVPKGFVPDQALSGEPLPEAVSPCWRSIGSGGSTGRPKLIEAGGDSRLGPALGYAVGGQEGDTAVVPVPLTHTTGFTSAAVALLMRQHLVLMGRFDPHEFLRLITEHRPQLVTTVPTMMLWKARPPGRPRRRTRPGGPPHEGAGDPGGQPGQETLHHQIRPRSGSGTRPGQTQLHRRPPRRLVGSGPEMPTSAFYVLCRPSKYADDCSNGALR